jgi:hypothetical protein
MRTTDLFKNTRSAKRINESIEKTFGKRLNLESFDLPKLEDARNKLRTQIHDARSQSGFNENIENEALTQAQWMLDAINAEIAEREEFVSDAGVAELEEAPSDIYEMEYMFYGDDGEEGYGTVTYKVVDGQVDPASLRGYCEGDGNNKLNDDWCTEMVQPGGSEHEEALAAAQEDYNDQSDNDDEGGETDDNYAMASAGFGSDEDYESIQFEKAPPGAKAERMVKHIKKGYADDGKLTKKEKGIAYATAWKQHNKEKNESIESGEDMTKLQEGEIQQASAIVTAKTMVDRVGRWIEELSGMENDTLLQLGDSIRDEMGSEQAKNFISACAPAIQAALEALKGTRETLSTGVRTLTGEEQPANMLGDEPEAGGMDDLEAPAEPDMMNAEPEADMGDEFGAADAAAGGLGDAGRAQRESIERGNSLLRVLAG